MIAALPQRKTHIHVPQTRSLDAWAHRIAKAILEGLKLPLSAQGLRTTDYVVRYVQDTTNRYTGEYMLAIRIEGNGTDKTAFFPLPFSATIEHTPAAAVVEILNGLKDTNAPA